MKRRTWLRWGIGAVACGFVAFNALAWQQAWAMTHYSPSGTPPPTIETLSLQEKARAVFLGIRVARPENSFTPRDVGLTFAEQRIALSAGTIETWIIEAPRSRVVVLLFPGYASSKDSLLAPAAVLHAQGYTTVLADFRGAGGSTGTDTTLGVREADDVAEVFAAARARWPDQPLLLYGVSMGSAAILHAVATRGIAPTALILESPFDSLLHTATARFQAFGLPATPAAQALIFWGGIQQHQNGFAFSPADDARRVRCPTLILHGERDPRATTAQSHAVFDQLGGEKEFSEFPDAGHALLIVTNRQDWQRVVLPFLSRSAVQR